MKSEFKFWRWAAVIGVLVLGIVGSIAVAAPIPREAPVTNTARSMPRSFHYERNRGLTGVA